MNTIDLVPREYNDRTIVYHFDVEQHRIPVRQFVDTAKATLAILDNFNEELFDNKGKFELRIITPQPGGFIGVFEVIVGVGGVIWASLSTDIGKAFIKGLTGHEPAFWSERLGEKSRKLIPNKDGGPPPDVMQLMVPEPESMVFEPEIEGDPKESMLLEAAVLAELIVRFLGLVDKLFDPHPCGHDMYESEIAFSGFVISCCQSTGILQLIEAPFDLVSQRIDEAIDRYRIFAH